MLKKLITASALSVGAMTLGTAQAALLTCPSNLTSLVSGTQACQYVDPAGTPSNPNDNGDQTVLNFVNQQGFFGNTDWMFGGSLTNGTGQSGTWNLSSFSGSSAWDDVMLLFKSGEGTTLVGYWLNDNATSGTWQSPFRQPPFSFQNSSIIRDVSYIRVYFTPGPGSGETPGGKVPEPATIGLLGLGLLGLFAARRRKQ